MTETQRLRDALKQIANGTVPTSVHPDLAVRYEKFAAEVLGTDYKYTIRSAWAQCGDAPPYNCIPLSVRNEDGKPQIKISGRWIDFPKDGPRPVIESHFGMTVAGIASDWSEA